MHDRGEFLGGKMNRIKICPCCKKDFMAESNAQKFCCKKCAALAVKKRKKKKKRYLCQWCGQVFKAERRKKFCNLSCQSTYMQRLGIVKKSVVKIPVKITIEDVAKNSKKEHLTYGRYVSLKRI